MPNDLFEDIEVPTTQTVNVGRTLKEMTLYAADIETPGVFAVNLATRDEAGKWRTDIPDSALRISDDLDATDPLARYMASLFQNLIFSGLVNESDEQNAMLIQGLLAYGIDIRGLTLWEASKLIIPFVKAQQEAAAQAALQENE